MAGSVTSNTSHDLKKYNFWLSSAICFAACIFLFYEFVLQVSTAVLSTYLMHDLLIDAAALGVISGAYYISYTFMQIPGGLLYDRYGPRLLLTIASLICAVGSFAFAHTDGIAGAWFGRLFMGLGSAFAFVGCLVLVARWFPAKYFALLAGVVQLMSAAGAFFGERPLAELIKHYGWRETIDGLAVVGVFVAILIWFVVRDKPKKQNKSKAKPHIRRGELKRLAQVCKKSQNWVVGMYAFSSWAPIVVFAALFGVPFMMTLYGISSEEAAGICSVIWISVGIGSPLVGWLSDHIYMRKLPLLICSIIALITSFIVIYVPDVPIWLMYILMLFFGLAASAQALSFALVKDNNEPGIVGTAIGFNNMAVVAGGFIFQPIVGFILKLGWDGTVNAKGVPIYNIGDFQLGLAIVPACAVLGIILCLFFMKESHCKPTYKDKL